MFAAVALTMSVGAALFVAVALRADRAGEVATPAVA
jgi:hypothetical protein